MILWFPKSDSRVFSRGITSKAARWPARAGAYLLRKCKQHSLGPVLWLSNIFEWCVYFVNTKLFYDLPPNKILYGSKQWLKERTSTDDSSLRCNASGSKILEPVIIVSKPRCGKGVEIEKGGIVYASNSNACVTGIFLLLAAPTLFLNAWSQRTASSL